MILRANLCHCAVRRFAVTTFLLISESIIKSSKILHKWTCNVNGRHSDIQAGVSRSLSQDVVDWSVAGTFWRTALGITSSWRESNHVPHSHCNSFIYRGQPVHNAGQTLQTGRSWSSVHCASWIHEERGNGIISDKQYVTQRNLKTWKGSCFLPFCASKL